MIKNKTKQKTSTGGDKLTSGKGTGLCNILGN